MSWKNDLKLTDLGPTERIEATCKRCGMTRYWRQAELMHRREMTQAYLDEVERALRCPDKFCRGGVRIALLHGNRIEGFVGGLP